jgi:predicted RNase H-like HicB family nuclease
LYSITTIKFKYWEDQEYWIGYLEEYPDYITQGESFEELKVNLTDIYHEFLKTYKPNRLEKTP